MRRPQPPLTAPDRLHDLAAVDDERGLWPACGIVRLMPGRDERRAMNEAYFRQWNEQVKEQVEEVAGDQATFNLACECSSLECAGRIALTPAEYEEIHEDPRDFIVMPGHVAPDIESTVLTTETFEVVRKHGRAGEVAEELADD